MKNNQQINYTDYYLLPCGKYLEDYILALKLDFAWGSALKYLWRAGRKDGESFRKDRMKATHYVNFIAANTKWTKSDIRYWLRFYIKQAKRWNGEWTTR